MKIAIISPRFYPTIGGGETYAYQLATSLSLLGHKITVITDRVPNRDLDTPYTIQEINGFDDRNPNLVTSLPELAKHFREHAYDVIQVHNYLSYFLFVNAIEETISSKIVFCTNNTPNIPNTVFSTFGDYESELLFARRLLDSGPHTTVISGSKDFSHSINEIAIKPQNVVYIPFAVDTKNFVQRYDIDVRKKYEVKNSEKLILSTSRFVRRKGLVSLIDALALLPKEYKLLLTGSAMPEGKETFNAITSAIARHELEDRVILVQEVVAFEDLPNLYQAADVFAITSEREGFGISIIEAMACGTPVVGTNVPGIRDLIKNGKTGMLVEYKDAPSLAGAIEELCANNALAQQLSDAARAMVESNYTVERMIGRHLVLYQNLLKKTSTRILQKSAK